MRWRKKSLSRNAVNTQGFYELPSFNPGVIVHITRFMKLKCVAVDTHGSGVPDSCSGDGLDRLVLCRRQICLRRMERKNEVVAMANLFVDRICLLYKYVAQFTFSPYKLSHQYLVHCFHHLLWNCKRSRTVHSVP